MDGGSQAVQMIFGIVVKGIGIGHYRRWADKRKSSIKYSIQAKEKGVQNCLKKLLKSMYGYVTCCYPLPKPAGLR